MLFPASVIGSLPRPDFVRDLIWNKENLSEDIYQKHLKAAINYAVALQEHVGLDVISDGEWGRTSYIGVIAELAEGFEVKQDPRLGHPPVFTVVRPLRAKNPGFIAKEATFLKNITNKGIKIALPSPALLGERMWNPDGSKKAYPDCKDFIRACVPILREELRQLEKIGVSVVQIDDPYLCLFVNKEIRENYGDWEKEVDFAVQMINELLAGFSVKTAVHLCRRAGARSLGISVYEGDFSPLLDHLNRLKTNELALEFTAPGAGDVSVLKNLRPDLKIGLGCVSVHYGQIDAVDTIVGRVEKALKVIAPERIILNPDCGFAPSSMAIVSLDEVYQKLKNEVEAARILRQRYKTSV